MKRFLAILLALTFILSLCACGKEDDGLLDKYDEDGKVVIQIGVRTNAKVTDLSDNSLTKWLEETTGYNIEIVELAGSASDTRTQVSAAIAANQPLPDILWGTTFPSVQKTYVEDGFFLDLREYYEDKDGASKTFWTRMEEELTEDQQEYVVQKITNKDTGAIYGVPTVETTLVDYMDYMVWINTEWLDTLQLEKPTNTEELYNVLVAFRDQDPNQNGLNDEIPLFGTQNGVSAAQVLNWLINLFIYYNDSYEWQDYDGDGQLDLVYTQDQYREALKFVNKLYSEGLLTNLLYTAENAETKTITTPASGTPICGIFVGHLTSNTTNGSEVLYQYENLKTWGYASEGSQVSASVTLFITETAKKRDVADECFAVAMALWSKEGSMRLRYGEYGTHWVEADEGAKSIYGIDAEYKLIQDVFELQGPWIWGLAHGTFLNYAEGESAQIDTNTDEWTMIKNQMHAEARKNLDEAAAEMNPDNLFLKSFYMTTAEEDSIDIQETNVGDYIESTIADFVCGTNDQDINDDADWAAFLAKLDELGLKDLQAMYQTCYERQK